MRDGSVYFWRISNRPHRGHLYSYRGTSGITSRTDKSYHFQEDTSKLPPARSGSAHPTHYPRGALMDLRPVPAAAGVHHQRHLQGQGPLHHAPDEEERLPRLLLRHL